MSVAEHGEVDVRWVSRHEWKLLVGGEWAEPQRGSSFRNESPVTEEEICEVPDASEQDVDAAVQAASVAADQWRMVGPRERARLVRRLADVLRKHREELAALDAIDVGNAYSYMLNDVDVGADSIDFMADLAFSLQGQTLPASATHLHYTRREPHGVVARIIPFNHPIMFAAQKIAAPLIAGNAVILKPSDISPLSALRMGELFAEMLPKGLLSVLVGKGVKMPRSLVRHPGVRRIGFTGSEPTGRSILRDAAEVGIKDITLELGGKGAIIVCPDAPIQAAADSVIRGMHFVGWQGQSCSATTRLLVHDAVVDELSEAVIAKILTIRLGSPLRPTTEMGTLASRTHYDRVVGYVEGAKAEGATVIAGGRRPSGRDFDRGFYYQPTLLNDVTPEMRIAREEVFGPVLSVIRWRDESEALALANSVEYGLSAAVWTRDLGRAHCMAHELEAGYVWINDAGAHFTGVPFGGYKSSGLGKEDCLDELISYSQLKAINVSLG